MSGKAPNELDKPVRINRYLALRGEATRRGADELVEKGLVQINGHMARLGDTVRQGDAVVVRRPRGTQVRHVYLAFHKPTGVNTHNEPGDGKGGSKSINDFLPATLRARHLFPVGRLDKDSSGLIILTDDGRITDRLLNPAHEHEKTYDVRTKLPLRSNFKSKMESGVDIENYTTKPAKVTILGERRFRITLTEGKTHQIRRMVVALFNEVASLRRIQIMNIRLGTLPSGEHRAIEGAELDTFLQSLGLKS